MLKHISGYLKRNSYKLYSIKLVHFFATIGLFFLFFLLFRYGKIYDIDHYNFRYNYFVTLLYAGLIIFFSRTYNSYLLGYSRIRMLIFGQLLSQFTSLLLIYIFVSLAWNHFDNPIPLLFLLIVQVIIDLIWSIWGNNYFYKINGKFRTLLIYRNPSDKKRLGSIGGKPTERIYQITDEIQYDGSFPELKKQLEGYDAIFVAGVNSSCRNGILKYCKQENIKGFFLPHIGDTIMQEAKHVQAFDSPVLFVERKELSPEYAIIKRLFDIFSSGIALLILSPVILLISLMIHLHDGGPVFYRQVRLTRDEKQFHVNKFSTTRIAS